MTLAKPTIGFFIFLHLGALLAFIPSTFCWTSVGLMLFMYWLTASVGICFGFHRYLSHRGMVMPRWLDYFIILLVVIGVSSQLLYEPGETIIYSYS